MFRKAVMTGRVSQVQVVNLITQRDNCQDQLTQEGSTDDVDKFLLECVPTKTFSELERLKYNTILLEKKWEKWKLPQEPRRRNILSCKEKRQLKVFDIQEGTHKFSDFVPLHQLWRDYMHDLLDMSRLALPEKSKCKTNYDRLLKADYHGCMMAVKKSTCPSLVGQSGIVLMETKNTFKVITKEDKIKCLPKPNTVFAFELEGHLITLYGDHFCVRAAERVRRKFKIKGTIDIG